MAVPSNISVALRFTRISADHRGHGFIVVLLVHLVDSRNAIEHLTSELCRGSYMFECMHLIPIVFFYGRIFHNFQFTVFLCGGIASLSFRYSCLFPDEFIVMLLIYNYFMQQLQSSSFSDDG